MRTGGAALSPTGLSPAVAGRSRTVRLALRLLTPAPGGSPVRAPLQPPPGIGLPPTEPGGFGLVPVRSPLLRESLVLSLPRGTEMFQFPRCPRAGLCVQPAVTSHDGGRVAPFGDPRISLLGGSPRRFVALPRPSSAPSAEASTARLYSAWPVPGPALRRVCGATCVSAARACDSGCVCLVGWLVLVSVPPGRHPAGRPAGGGLSVAGGVVRRWVVLRPTAACDGKAVRPARPSPDGMAGLAAPGTSMPCRPHRAAVVPCVASLRGASLRGT